MNRYNRKLVCLKVELKINCAFDLKLLEIENTRYCCEQEMRKGIRLL